MEADYPVTGSILHAGSHIVDTIDHSLTVAEQSRRTDTHRCAGYSAISSDTGDIRAFEKAISDKGRSFPRLPFSRCNRWVARGADSKNMVVTVQ